MARRKPENYCNKQRPGKKKKPEARKEKRWARRAKGRKRKDAVTRSLGEFGVRKGGDGAGRRGEPGTTALPERRTGSPRGLAGKGRLPGRSHTKGAAGGGRAGSARG